MLGVAGAQLHGAGCKAGVHWAAACNMTGHAGGEEMGARTSLGMGTAESSVVRHPLPDMALPDMALPSRAMTWAGSWACSYAMRIAAPASTQGDDLSGVGGVLARHAQRCTLEAWGGAAAAHPPPQAASTRDQRGQRALRRSLRPTAQAPAPPPSSIHAAHAIGSGHPTSLPQPARTPALPTHLPPRRPRHQR